MKNKSAIPSAKVILWRWSLNSAGRCPVKLCVYYGDERKYFPVIFRDSKLFLLRSEWESVMGKNPRHENKRMRNTIDQVQVAANHAINVITANKVPFTFNRFTDEYLGGKSTDGFLRLFVKHLEAIRSEGRIGTWKSYRNAYNAFNRFRGGKMEKQRGTRQQSVKPGKELQPIDVTPTLLKNFAKFLADDGAGKTTIGIYMRALKVVFNLAADDNPSLRQFYPFATRQSDRNKYKIKTGSGHKGEALTIEQLQDLIALETESGTPEHEAKMLWLFSFYAQGMNFKDISLLKYSNIEGETVNYIREKTKDTETEETVIEIPLTDKIRSIISSIGNPDKRKSAYVFNIISSEMNLEKQDSVIKQKIKMVNIRLKDLCTANDLPAVTTYWARHSYANLQRESGASVDDIRQLLGHSDVRTTEVYLKRFDIHKKKAASDRIEKLLETA